MQFIILDKLKLIIFWSPKCGCSTLKHLLAVYFNILDPKYAHIHVNKELQEKIKNSMKRKDEDYKNYDIAMLIRNPYERLVSGFLNKYVLNTHYYKNPPNCNNFYDFCHALANTPEKIDEHHFENQTAKNFDFYNKLNNRENVKYIIDTKNVNYFSKILDLNLSDIKLNDSQSYFMQEDGKSDKEEKQELWFLDYKSLCKLGKLNYSNFYNDELRKLVFKIYKDDFNFFSDSLNVNYTI